MVDDAQRGLLRACLVCLKRQVHCPNRIDCAGNRLLVLDLPAQAPQGALVALEHFSHQAFAHRARGAVFLIECVCHFAATLFLHMRFDIQHFGNGPLGFAVDAVGFGCLSVSCCGLFLISFCRFMRQSLATKPKPRLMKPKPPAPQPFKPQPKPNRAPLNKRPQQRHPHHRILPTHLLPLFVLWGALWAWVFNQGVASRA
jgi:hypothetical protein